MPALILFGKRWKVGSDDFVFPIVVAVTIRVIWFVITAIIWPVQSTDINTCNQRAMIHGYFFGVALVLLLTIYWNSLLTKISMQGAIMQIESRKLVPFILYIRILLAVADFGCNVYGTVLTFGYDLGCSSTNSIVQTLQGFVSFNWILQSLMILSVLLTIDPVQKKYTQSSLTRTTREIDPRHQSIWKRRCKLMCCSCLPGHGAGRETQVNTFDDVANLLVSLFRDDLVVTDIVAGLILLNMRYKRDKKKKQIAEFQRSTFDSHQEPAENDAENFSLDDIILEQCVDNSQNDWMNVDIAQKYFKFAHSSYGLPLYTYDRLVECECCMPSDLRRFTCINCRKPHQVVGDNCCLGNLAAVKATTNLTNEGILYATFNNDIFEVVFYVAVDHELSSVILAIRGTLSLSDAITDMQIYPEPIFDREHSPPWTAHKGMLFAAKTVLSKLGQDRQLLRKALAENPGYQLVITGHSLGAGTAAVLSILLREQFPNLKCIAYSPPGGLLCYEAACYSQQFCMSVIFGRDIVPRLSLQSIQRLKCHIQNEITRCPHPKYRILMHGSWQSFFGYFIKPITSLIDEYSTNANNYMTDNLSNYEQEELIQPMYLPGRILQIDKKQSADRQSTKFFFYWAHYKDYQDIRVTPRMLTDHLTTAVRHALDQVSNSRDDCSLNHY